MRSALAALTAARNGVVNASGSSPAQWVLRGQPRMPAIARRNAFFPNTRLLKLHLAFTFVLLCHKQLALP
jgi:hypothetical protein